MTHDNGGPTPQSTRPVTGTFSIVAADPEAGEVGAAVASRYPAVGKVVPFVRAGVGAFCTQHWHNPEWGDLALDLLAEGALPEEILGDLLQDDPDREKRQLGIVDATGRAANRNPDNPDEDGVWWGAMSGKHYAVQGNTLAGRKVVTDMGAAFEDTKGTLADRLVAALLAGDRAGGDHRGRLAAAVIVARDGDAEPVVDIHVDESDDAVEELARLYADLHGP